MFQLKPISREAIEEALQKAERYRLLNEPQHAESICQDVLDVDPTNHQAMVTKILAITDQFGKYSTATASGARQLLPLLENAYDRQYFAGIICERQGNAYLYRGGPGDHYVAYDWLTEAMEYFEKAEAIRPPGQDDAILRWNTCARQIMNHRLEPRKESFADHPLE